MLDGPRDRLIRARVEALSEIYAAWAGQDTDIDMFRSRALMRRNAGASCAWLAGGSHPGYRLLTEDEVNAWVVQQHNATAPTRCVRRTC